MIDLKLSFDHDTMLQLTNEQFNELASTGETITDFAPAKDYWIDEEFSRLFLSYNSSLSDYFFVFEPETDIDIFMSNSYLTHFFPKTGKIKLIKDYEQPLNELLVKRRREIVDIFEIDKLNFRPGPHIFGDACIEASVKQLVTTGNFKGEISCCVCGENVCSSAYLWAEDNVALATFGTLASEFQTVQFYPFKVQ